MAADMIVNFSLFFKCSNTTGENDDFLIKKQIQLMKCATEIMDGYIWQKEKFHVQRETTLSNSETCACLKGTVNCGENIEDEWFIVYILLQISKSDHDLIISITDDDGQFLLIEAADYLPRWLNPDTSENRVYIHNGRLHVIPLPSNPAEVTILPAGKPSIQEAIRIVLGNHDTLADERIQNVIHARIGRFDVGFSHLFHNAHCLIPRSLAYVLKKDPSAANRILDILDQYVTETISKQRKCLGTFDFDDWILSRVCFTKYTYAKLLNMSLDSKKFVTEMRRSRVGYSFKACDLGFKLGFGFDMLCKAVSRKETYSEDIQENEEKWLRFLSSLKRLGYFKDEIEGSAKWQRLCHDAKDFFYASSPTDEKKEIWQCKNFLTLLEDSTNTVLDEDEILPEDDDSWLEISPDEVDKLLQGHHQPLQSEGIGERLDDVAQSMRRFVGKVSDFEGVETNNDQVEFDAKSIIAELKKIMDGKTVDERDEDLDSDDCDSDQYLSDNDLNGTDLAEIQSLMDRELRETTLSKSFHSDSKSESPCPDGEQTIDIDFNLVKNFLESVASEEGAMGPVSNILSSIGISLPHDESVTSDPEE